MTFPGPGGGEFKGFSADSPDIEVDCRDAGNLSVTVRNPLGHALMRPGGVVVDLVLDQDGPQMRFTEDQHAVQELAAQGTEEAFAGDCADQPRNRVFERHTPADIEQDLANAVQVMP